MYKDQDFSLCLWSILQYANTFLKHNKRETKNAHISTELKFSLKAWMGITEDICSGSLFSVFVIFWGK